MSDTTDYLDDLRECQAHVAALTAERDAAVEKSRQWALRGQEAIDRLAALTAEAHDWAAKCGEADGENTVLHLRVAALAAALKYVIAGTVLSSCAFCRKSANEAQAALDAARGA